MPSGYPGDDYLQQLDELWSRNSVFATLHCRQRLAREPYPARLLPSMWLGVRAGRCGTGLLYSLFARQQSDTPMSVVTTFNDQASMMFPDLNCARSGVQSHVFFPKCPIRLPDAATLDYLRTELPSRLKLKNISYHRKPIASPS